MTTLEAIKKAIKMNEALKQFALKPKYIALDISNTRFEIETLEDLKNIKSEYVKEFYDSVMNVELNEFFEARGQFVHSTYEGKCIGETWTSDYDISLIVAN